MVAIFCSAGCLCGPAWWLSLDRTKSQFTQKQAAALFLTLKADPGQHVFWKAGRRWREEGDAMCVCVCVCVGRGALPADE